MKLLWLLIASSVSALAPTRHALLQRRALLQRLAVVSAAGLTNSANALPECRKGANNCFSREWTAPSAGAAVKDLKAAIATYPQEGQGGIDLGGYTYAVDELASKGYARLEFKSGIGNFARFLNGGKPFIDDLELQVDGTKVAVRSASRVGDSDFGVNNKRMDYIAAALKTKGWN